NLAILLHKTGRPKEAGDAMRDALTLQKQLAADFPDRTDFRRSLARTYTGAGVLWNDLGQPGEAERALEAAKSLLEKLVKESPNPPPRGAVAAPATDPPGPPPPPAGGWGAGGGASQGGGRPQEPPGPPPPRRVGPPPRAVGHLLQLRHLPTKNPPVEGRGGGL